MSGRSWLTRPMLALDTETTGTNPETARLVQICLGLAAEPGRWRAFTTLVDPGVPIPAEAAAVHGITDAMVKGAPTPAEAIRRLQQVALVDASEVEILVGHNITYDLTVIEREAARAGLGSADIHAGRSVLDTLVLYRRFDWTTGGRTLSKLAGRHGITFPAHDAEADALASLRILHILAKKNDLLPLIAPRDLHEAQKHWWIEQQDRAQSLALGNGRNFVPQPYWPLIPATEGVGS